MTPSLASAQRLVVKIGSALVVEPDEAAPRTAWLAGIAADIADAARARGGRDRGVLRRHRAGAAHAAACTQQRLRLEEKQAAAAVGQIRLAQAWSEALSAHGPDRGAAAADAGRYRGPPPLPERPRHAEHAAGARLHPGDQRERHRRHRGNPLRRQRPAGRARRRDDAGRPVDPAVRHRRALHRRPAARSGGRAHRRRSPAITPEIEAMGGEPPPGYSSGGMRTKLAAARIATQAGCAMAIALRPHRPAAAGAGGGRALHLVPAGAGGPLGAQALDRRRAGAAGHADGRCRRGAGAEGGAVAAAGRRARGRGRVRARRSGGGARARTASRWRAACRLMPAATRSASSATGRTRSRRSWAGAAATRSSTATIWCCCNPRPRNTGLHQSARRAERRPPINSSANWHDKTSPALSRGRSRPEPAAEGVANRQAPQNAGYFHPKSAPVLPTPSASEANRRANQARRPETAWRTSAGSMLYQAVPYQPWVYMEGFISTSPCPCAAQPCQSGLLSS